MKLSKKYLKKIKKRLLGCMSSIAICLMIATVSTLSVFPMPKNISSTKRSKPEAFTETENTTSSKSNENRKPNTETDIYIYDTYDIEIFRNSVNAGNDYAGKTVHLMNNIDLRVICSEEIGSWEPIGTYYTDFAGTFDGNYNTISNLYINTDKYQTIGFFKKTGKTAIIKNLILEGVNITSTYVTPVNNTYVGGLVGWHEEGAQILNCGIKSGTIKDEITESGDNSQYGPIIGGIAGRSNGLIDCCYNKARIIGTAPTSTSATDVMIGGLAGAGRGKLTNSYNTGEIIGTSYVNYVGGISGNTDNSYTGKIENTYNKGVVTYTGTTNYVGGILGRNGYMEDYSAIEFENSYATNSNINAQYNYNGTSVVESTIGRITSDELKGSVVALGEKYEVDLYGINDKDPILYWEAEYPLKAKLNVNQAYIEVGEIIDLNVLYSKEIEEIIGHSYTSSDFKWTSTNEDIAKVNENGRVTGLKEGYTTIYATYENSNVGEGLASSRINAMSIINVTGKIATPQVGTGNGFTAVLKADGTVWTIGNNDKGQLGNKTTENTDIVDNKNTEDTTNVGAIINRPQTSGAIPQQVKINETTNLTNIIKIAVGTDHVLALSKTGEIYAWGGNEYGQLATENTTGNTIENNQDNVGAGPVSARIEPYATKVLGTNGMGTLKNIVDIGTGEKTSVALDKEGNVYEWGNGKDLPTKHNIDNIVRISVGKDNIGALESNGLLWTWGENEKGQTGSNSTTSYTWPLAVETEVTEVDSGGRHTVIEKTDGKIYATGNLYGTKTFEEIELPETVTETNGVKYIKAGYDTTTIMLKDGTIYGEGGNREGQLGIGTQVDATKFTQGLILVGDRADTGPAPTEDNDNGESTSNISPLTSVIMLGDNIGDGATTSLNTTAITKNGDIYISGDNTYSQIGDGTTESTSYYKKMGFVSLDYKDKIVPVHEQGYMLDKSKLRYIFAKINAYSQEEEIESTLGEIKFTSLDESIATVDETGLILGQVPTGEVRIKIEDITNGYETYVTAKVSINRLENTDTVEYIYNIEDLVRFRDSVNAGNNYAGKTVYVMADIDMSPACSEIVGSWEPIGATGTIFAGTFEGNYHKLSNLYIDDNTYQYLGLFTQTASTTTIQNLVIDNANVKTTYYRGVKAENYVGGIVGGNDGAILNCGVTGRIDGRQTQSTIGDRYVVVGGITGRNLGTIDSCYNSASISSYTNTSNNANNSRTGGIAGLMYTGTIKNCYNTGSLNVEGARFYVGGIVGCFNGAKCILQNSYNIGTITINGSSNSTKKAGGIVGVNGDAPGYVGTIKNTYCTTSSYEISYYYNYNNITTEGRIEPEVLKTYAPILGSAFENDDFNINDGYPILWWEAPTIELNKKQEYIKAGENLQLEIIQNENLPNALVGKTNITDFEWKSTNEDIATVNQNALVTGLTEGYTTIYGTHKEYNNVNVECIINVSKAESVATPQIETGNGFTAVLKADGTVWTIGNNEKGGLGNGTVENTDIVNNNNTGNTTNVGAIINRTQTNGASPQQVKISETEYLTDVIKISTGTNHVLALTKNGEVYAWGDNTYGQLGNGTTGNAIDNNPDDVGAGSVSAHTGHAQRVLGEGGESFLKRIIDISAGEASSVAINEFGWTFVWGNGTYGEMGNGGIVSSNTPVKTVISTGISAGVGTGHVVALGQNGKTYTWGRNTYGELGIGNTANNTVVGKIAEGITEISVAGYETIVKDIEGNVYGTGLNTEGQLGIGTNSNVTTLTKMTLPEIENTENVNPDDVGAISNRPHVKYIKAGITNTTLMLSDGTIWSTGANTNGELGNGTNTNSNTLVQGKTLVENRADTGLAPTEEQPLTDVLFIGRNNGSDTPVILENGKVYIAGSNEYKQITNEEADTRYFTEMRYVEITAPEKIEVLAKRTKTLTEEELQYKKDTFNVYKDDILTIPLIEYAQIEDETLAIYENGEIQGKIVGKTQLKVEEESTGTVIYIPVRVYEIISGRITTENYIGTHIAKVKIYRKRKKEDEYEEEYEGDDILIKELDTKEDGTYVVDIDEVGIYDVLITKEGYLDYKVAEIEIKEGPIVELQEYELIAGDVAEDGEIEINDLVDMNRELGKEITEENKEEKGIYDLNEDGKIDKKDRDILKKNYGKRAEETKWVKTEPEVAMTNLDIVEDTKTTDVGEIINRPQINGGMLANTKNEYILPIKSTYQITSEYGTRVHPTTGEEKTHHGIDLVGTHHTEILAVADGTITFAGVQNGYGNCVEIKHTINGKTIYSFYAHLSKIDVEVGDKITKGQIIGQQGGGETDPNPGTSTGEHLHFELRTASGSGHAIDPREYIQF